jgi:hypothetical protein
MGWGDKRGREGCLSPDSTLSSKRDSRARQQHHILSDYRLNTSAQTRWCFQQSAYALQTRGCLRQSAYADTYTATTEQSETIDLRVQKYTYRAESNHRFRIQKYTYRAERNNRFRVQKSWKLNFHVLIHALMEWWIIQCGRKKCLHYVWD